LLLKSTLAISILLAVALLLPLTFDNTAQARYCVPSSGPFGDFVKGIINSPVIKNSIQKKIAENVGNKSFLKVLDEASKNMTKMVCSPGEVPTLFNETAPPYFPASNKTVNSTNPELNSSLTKDTISFKATLQPPSNPSIFLELDIPGKSNFNFGLGNPYVLLMIVNKD
jgi:hypothetical protein